MLLTDCKNWRFELEHGDANEEDDAALYGGQIFAYLKERP